MSEAFFVPDSVAQTTEDAVWRWYGNIRRELTDLDLSKRERDLMSAYYEDAGLLRAHRAGFFRRHYSTTVARAVGFLFGHHPRPRLLDLGCGTGTQSLIFAILGAYVIALDMDSASLEILRKRKSFYESLLGRELRIETYCTDSFQFDYGRVGPIDAMFSMFAFNMMQPSRALLHRIAAASGQRARAAILDGNNRSWLARTLPSRRRNVLSPEALRVEFERLGWRVVWHRGAVSLPPFTWLGPRTVLEPLDDVLAKSWLFPVSHLLMAERTS